MELEQVLGLSIEEGEKIIFDMYRIARIDLMSNDQVLDYIKYLKAQLT